MTEDSGAFKTKPRNSAQIGHFVIAGDRAWDQPWDRFRVRCGKDASPHEKRRRPAQARHHQPIL
jgi:hypothetical protein